MVQWRVLFFRFGFREGCILTLELAECPHKFLTPHRNFIDLPPFILDWRFQWVSPFLFKYTYG